MTRRAVRARRLLLLVSAGLLVLVPAGVAGWATRTDLAHVRTDLADATADVAATRPRVSAAAAALAEERDRADAARSELRARTAERDGFGAALDSLTGDLAQLRDELVGRQERLARERRRLEALDECLVGTERILNRVATGDVGDLEDDLAAVLPSCTAARRDA